MPSPLSADVLDGIDSQDPSVYGFGDDDQGSPLRIDITGAGGSPAAGGSSDLPHVDMADHDHPVAPGVDLTRARAKLPPDPIDSLFGAEDQLLISPLMQRMAGASDRLRGALSDSEDMSNRGRDELEAMRSHIYRGSPWAAFTAAVSQPSWGGAMASLGKAAGAYGAEKSRLAGQDMDIDRLLGNFDASQGQQMFRNRLGLENFDLNSMNAASKLATIRYMLATQGIKMRALQSAFGEDGSGASGGSGGAPGQPGGAGNNFLTLKQAWALNGIMPGTLKAWEDANPHIVFNNTGKYLIPTNPVTGKVAGDPIPLQIPPADEAKMRDQGIAIPGQDGGPSASPAPAAPASAASPSSSAAAGSGNTPSPNSQPASAPTGNNPTTPNAQPTQPQSSAQPSEADTAKNVDAYIAQQGLAPAQARALRAKLLENQPKSLEGTRSSVDTTNAVVKSVDDILSKVQSHPNLQAGPVGTALSYVWGTPEYDTSKRLETIKHNMMRDAIDALRASSPTGALNMRITEAELEQMQSRIANLNMGQSPQQFMGALRDIRNHFVDMQNRARGDYERVYGKGPDSQFGVRQTAPQAAVDFLKAHPETKQHFLAKYGYLPDGE